MAARAASEVKDATDGPFGVAFEDRLEEIALADVVLLSVENVVEA